MQTGNLLGDRNSMRPAAGRAWMAGLLLAAILCTPVSADSQPPRETAGPPLSGPSDLSDWVLSDSVAPGSAVQFQLANRGPRLAPGPHHVGPVRRWIHGLFGHRFATAGPGHGGPAYAADQPLLREEWLFRPFSVGWFMGGVAGGTLMDDWVNQESGFFGGYRLGWDYTRYWGCEMRFAFGWIELADSQRAIEAQQVADDAIGLPHDHPFRERFEHRRDSDRFLWDVSLLYYPWGDVTWRPYLLAGLGAARIDFLDRLSVRRAETVFAVPLGAGVKYRCCDWLAFRVDVTDNIAFGKEFNTVHDLAFTGGVEIRFGGTRKAYWPWNPGRHYW